MMTRWRLLSRYLLNAKETMLCETPRPGRAYIHMPLPEAERTGYMYKRDCFRRLGLLLLALRL